MRANWPIYSYSYILSSGSLPLLLYKTNKGKNIHNMYITMDAIKIDSVTNKTN